MIGVIAKEEMMAGIWVYKYCSEAHGEHDMQADNDKGLGHVGVSGSGKKDGCTANGRMGGVWPGKTRK